MSDILAQIIENAYRDRPTALDLGNCGLQNFPMEVLEMDWLQELMLSSEWYEWKNDKWEVGKSRNGGKPNRIHTLPENLGRLKNLRKLVIEGGWLVKWDLSDLGPLASLQHLEYLYVGYTGVFDLRPLQNLQNLRFLYISHARITDLAPLGALHKLEHLFINANRIADLAPLAKLTNLQQLDISSTLVEELTPLNGLSNLKVLDLGSTPIRDIRPLANLGAMQHLVLRNIKIDTLQALSSLGELVRLDIRNTEVRELEPLQKLNKLQKLFASNTHVENIEPLRHLDQLTQLFLSNTNVRSIEPILGLIKKNIPVVSDWESGEGIVLNKCPLTDPPAEIVKNGNDAIVQYFESKAKQGEALLFEAKLLIVGEPGAGKTTLRRKLIDRNAELPTESESTRGIAIQHYPFNTRRADRQFTAHIWDFGGQEIYKATHQFFLTRRSVYVLVADNRREDTDFNYWLHSIETFGGESPLLILFNEKAERQQLRFNPAALRSQFPNLKETLEVNLRTNKGLDQVINAIEFELESLPHIGEYLPAQWVKIREDLLEHAAQTPFIKATTYYDICDKYGVQDQKEQDILSDYLHDLGVFLFFRQDPLLRRLIILNNEWATEGVYKVLDNPDIIQKKGEFDDAILSQVFRRTQWEEKQPELLRLMLNFELCYQVPNRKPETYIMPQLLPSLQPEYNWNPEQAPEIHVRYNYEFMPKGILTRLIVRLHHHIEDQGLVWKDGVLLKNDDGRAEIIENYPFRRIDIRVSGREQRVLMSGICEEIDALNRTFPKIKVQKLVPCNCAECAPEGADRHFFRYETLMRARERGRFTVECEKSFLDVSILSLIDAVFVQGHVTLSNPYSTVNAVRVRELLENNMVEEALALMPRTDEVSLLRARFRGGQQDFAVNLIQIADWQQIIAQVRKGILDLLP